MTNQIKMSTVQVTFPDIIDNHKYGENIYFQSLEQYSWIDRLYNQHEEKQRKINTATQILNSANRLEAKISEEETQRTKGDIDIMTMLGQNIANTMQSGAIQINNMRNAIQTDIFLNEKRLTKTMSYTESTQTALTLHTMYSLNSSFISAFITNNSTFGAYRKQNFANMLSSHTMFMEAINNFTDLERLNIVRTSSLVATLLDGTERFNERLINQITTYNNFFVSTTSFTQQLIEFQNKEVVARIDKLTEGVDYNIDVTNERINALYNRTAETHEWLFNGTGEIHRQVHVLSGLANIYWPGYTVPYPPMKLVPDAPGHLNSTTPPHNFVHKLIGNKTFTFTTYAPAPAPPAPPAPAPAPIPGFPVIAPAPAPIPGFPVIAPAPAPIPGTPPSNYTYQDNVQIITPLGSLPEPKSGFRGKLLAKYEFYDGRWHSDLGFYKEGMGYKRVFIDARGIVIKYPTFNGIYYAGEATGYNGVKNELPYGKKVSSIPLGQVFYTSTEGAWVYMDLNAGEGHFRSYDERKFIPIQNGKFVNKDHPGIHSLGLQFIGGP